jgi:hypothetical protein
MTSMPIFHHAFASLKSFNAGLTLATISAAIIVLQCCIPSTTNAQNPFTGLSLSGPTFTNPNWGTYDPYRTFSSRIYWQADLIRAQGQAAVDYAQARGIHADAYSKELDNWEKEVRAYWDRKITGETKSLELAHVRQIARLEYLNDRKWTNNRNWDRIKNHPELTDSSIASGRALNFLLYRLSASALPYQFDPKNSPFGDDVLTQLKLDDAWLGDVLLQHGKFRFPANQTLQEQINLWPYILRWEEFDAERHDIELAREAVIAESKEDGKVDSDSIKRFQTAIMVLSKKLHRSETVAEYVKVPLRYTHFGLSDRFLRQLDREVTELEKRGDIRPFQNRKGFDPATDGDHAIGLLCFMNRNGVEFAPATPGNEHAYHNLYVMMRALYLTVADSDESIQPKNLSDEIN